MSHDWPQGIEHHGDLQGLLRRKPFFQEDISKGELGSPPLTELLKKLRPKRWFSAHLHVKFEAKFLHGTGSGVAVATANPEEIAIDDEDFDDPKPATATPSAQTTTAPATVETLFLALDKCLPRRQYLEVIDFGSDAGALSSNAGSTSLQPNTLLLTAESSDGTIHPSQDPAPPDVQDSAEPDLASYSLPTSFGKPSQSRHTPDPQKVEPKPRTTPELMYDIEWLAICRAFHPFLSLQHTEIGLPPEPEMKKLINKAREWVEAHVGEGKKIVDVQNFGMTAPGASGPGRQSQQVPREFSEPLKVLPSFA
jgi:lariat debranching enzyme